MTFVSTPRTLSTAPLPRPPQPMTPTRIGMSFAAWLVRTKGKLLTAAAPAAASEECFRNERRERAGESLVWDVGLFMRRVCADEADFGNQNSVVSLWDELFSGSNGVCYCAGARIASMPLARSCATKSFGTWLPLKMSRVQHATAGCAAINTRQCEENALLE